MDASPPSNPSPREPKGTSEAESGANRPGTGRGLGTASPSLHPARGADRGAESAPRPSPARILLAVLGAALGGGAGVLVYLWLLDQGFGALAVVGIGIGLGAKLLGGAAARGLAIYLIPFAAVLSLIAYYIRWPLNEAHSFWAFLGMLPSALGPVWAVMILFGVFAAYYFARD